MSIELRALAAVSGVVAVGLLATGCSGSAASLTEDVSPPELGVIPAVSSGKDIRLPLDSYYLTKDQDLLLQRAVNGRVEECMRRNGFKDYRAPTDGPPNTAPDRSRLFGVLNAAEVAKFGYRGGSWTKSDAEEEAKARLASALSPAEAAALSGQKAGPGGTVVPGSGSGGCLGDARRVIDGSEIDVSVLDSLAVDYASEAENDPRAGQAKKRWSECMAKAGFQYSDPRAAYNDSRWASGDMPGSEEIATAAADVRCKRETNYVGMMTALNSAYQRRGIEKDAGKLQEFTATRDRVLAAAGAQLTTG